VNFLLSDDALNNYIDFAIYLNYFGGNYWWGASCS